MSTELHCVQEHIHHRFEQVKLLELALTHSSWANEQGGDMENNERLEFLGDAVLEICVSEELFTRFPDLREGELTRMRAALVSKPALARVAKDLELDKHVLLGRGEETQGGRTRKSLLSDVLEAVLGAIFLDGGYSAAKAWVAEVFADMWPQQPQGERSKDFKSELQEATQRIYRDRPVYTLVSSEGPEHAKVFRVVVRLPSGEEIAASGPSVKKAEQRAAGRALEQLGQADAPDSDGE